MADNNAKKMDLLKNTDQSPVINSPYLNKYRRAISAYPTNPVPLRRFASDTTKTIVFMPLNDINENLSNESSPVDNMPTSENNEVRITLEDESTTSSTMKMNLVEAWCRRNTPNCITCHQVWLVIHIFVTIILCISYFTKIIKVSAGTIAICELLFGVLVRNEIFIALLHRFVASLPYFKYECNRMLHCIGGLHVSSAIAAFFWLLISLSNESHGLVVQITGGIILFLVLFLSLTAIPIVRRRFHNIFEYVHRYVGWICLIVLILHVIFLQIDKYDTFKSAAILNEAVLIVIIIIVIIFLPWMCVRKVYVQFKQPSQDLTIVTFPQALYPYGSTTRISSDGREWHAFAIALTDPLTNQHSILVAAAGDWTKKLAEDYRNDRLPQYLWIRRIKGLGFMYSIHAYQRVLIVCTGSGIAPALPYIKDPLPTTHIHLLWIAKQHERNYGEYIWSLIQKLEPYVTLHDTGINGRPGPHLIEENFRKTNSQAVFVVSNEKFTLEVTNTLWRKGIPCFGALFDS